MKGFIDKLIERLGEISELIRPVGWSRKIEVVETKAVVSIANQLAKEYRQDLDKDSQGWIPCSDLLPEEAKENPVTKDYYKYPCIYKNGNVTDIRYFAFGCGNWLNGCEIMDDYVLAWFDIFNTLPAPYQPKGE